MLDSLRFSVETLVEARNVRDDERLIIFVVANVVVLSSETRPYPLNRVTGEIVAAIVYNFSEELLAGL